MFRLAFFALALYATTAPAADPTSPDKGKATAERVKGMKAAVAEIEKGKLKLHFPPAPFPAWHQEYVASLKKECGVEAEAIAGVDRKRGEEMDGYNDVMRTEIEYRFGKGILDKLQKRAEEKSP
jgi:hypothetical protein